MKTALLIGLLLLIPGPGLAYEQALQEQVAAKNWHAADRILRSAKRECHAQDGVGKCKDKIAFSHAWVNTRRGDEGGVHSAQYYRRAAAGYQAVLRDNPGHLPTLDNLILVLEQLDDRAGLEVMLAQLTQTRELARAAQVALIIASSYRAENNAVRAFAYYLRSYELGKQPQAFKGTVAAFEAAPNQDMGKRLLDLGRAEDNLTNRILVCEALIRNRESIDYSLWESATISWLAWMGRARLLTHQVVKQSFDLGANPELRDLFDSLRDPGLRLEESELQLSRMTLADRRIDGWWSDSLVRSWAYAIAAWSEGHNRLVAGKVHETNSIWLAAMQYAPPTYAYDSNELQGRWAISLELITDFARLQQLYKAQLDPDGNVFRRVERLLFDSKAQAYKVNDLVAIQRHHTLMGKMYADIGIFSQRDHGARSAEFQLKHALKTARLRSEETRVEDPQPSVARLLGDGYSCQLPNQKSCTLDDKKAVHYYQGAVTDFIKLDAVEPARQSLQALKKYQVEPVEETIQLQNLIDIRASLPMDRPVTSRDDPDVLSRQIDLANQWQKLGDSARARESLDQALQGRVVETEKAELYESLQKGDVEKIKKSSRDKLLIYKKAQ